MAISGAHVAPTKRASEALSLASVAVERGISMRKRNGAVPAVLPVAVLLAVLAAASAGAKPGPPPNHGKQNSNGKQDSAPAAGPATASAPSNNGSHDFAVGGFLRANVEMSHTGFSAQSGPQGQAAKGHLSSTSSGGLKERYRVTCLAVSGSDAAMGLVPTNAPRSNAGTERVLSVHDGGLPRGGGDRYTFWFTSASNCASFVGGAGFTRVRGNIVVHDAP